MYESRFLGFSGVEAVAASVAARESDGSAPTTEMPTTRAPVPLRNERRDVMSDASPLRHRGRCALDGANDGQVAATPAQVVGQTLADVRFARRRVVVQQNHGLHDHAVGAVAALRGLLVDE